MGGEIEALFIAGRVFDRIPGRIGRAIRNPKSLGTISREGVENERNGMINGIPNSSKKKLRR